MANNTSFVTWNRDWVYLIGEDFRALFGGGSLATKAGATIWKGEWPYQKPVTKINPRYIEACALVRSRYDRDARGGTQLLLRERDGSRRSLEQM
jgi:hypothetical protein